ncbi:MAG: heme-binding protein [Solirubrobacteraceae bacterium]
MASAQSPEQHEPVLVPATSQPSDFVFSQALGVPRDGPAPPPPGLEAIESFAGDWEGTGFNTIFRPNSPSTPTVFPEPASGDNVLGLNLTKEILSFSAPLGTVPNRGVVEADAFLNGVDYLQTIEDVTIGPPKGIHVEPGIWIAVPPTTTPAEGRTYVRMAPIPHGATICAQGTASTSAGRPEIPHVEITPGGASGGGHDRFPSQTASESGTARIPQDFTAFIAAGTITREVLDNPNVVLVKAIADQTITSTTTIKVSTAPEATLFGGASQTSRRCSEPQKL